MQALGRARGRVVAGVVLAAAALWLMAGASAWAQEPGGELPLEILDVHHDPAGTLTIALRAGGSRDIEIRSLTVFLNDVPVSLDVVQRPEAEPLALALVIDTSGSMAGPWMEAAREAAHALVERLPEGDRVAVLSFATEPVVHTPLTENQALVAQAIDTLQAGGWTALYDSVFTGIDALEDAPEPRRVLVLLADGEDNISEATAEASLERAAASGVMVYTVGIGRLFDPSYLEELAEVSGGQFAGLVDEHDDGALAAVFSRIGGQLGSRDTYQIPMRPLAQGTHELRLRAVVNDETVTNVATFEVTNRGLLAPVVEAPAEEGNPIALRLNTAVAPSELGLEARVDGRVFRPDTGSDTIALDPWRLPAGEHTVDVLALARGELAARETVNITVPELAPLLTVTERGDELVARGRVQQAEPPTVVALVNGEEIGRGTRGELIIERSGAGVTFEVLDATGEVVATEQVAALDAAADAAGGTSPLLPILLLLAAGGAGAWIWRRRRAAAPAKPTVQAVQRVVSRPRPPLPEGEAPPERREVRVGTLIVRDPDGQERSMPLTRRPLTIGSGSNCDVVLDDPSIRPVHARLTAFPNGEVQIHALAHRGPRPYEEGQIAEDQWLVIQHGEQVALGDHVLHVLLDGEESAERDSEPPESTERAS